MIDVIEVISGFTPQRHLGVNCFKLVNCLIGFHGTTLGLPTELVCKNFASLTIAKAH